MKSMRRPLGAIIVAALLGIGLLGCPPDVGMHLLVSTDTLDFGMDQEELRLRVHKTYTGAVMEPLVVTADDAWVLPQNCLDVADNCISRGPDDAIRIPVRIDRSKLALGINESSIRLRSKRSSDVVVTVIAEEILQADFRAKSRSVGLGQPAEFLDMSTGKDEAGTIESWLWDFGDGAISTRRNPSHLYSAPGRYDVSLTVTTDNNIVRTTVKPRYVEVKQPANEVNFVASKTNVDVNEAITFKDVSTIEDTPVLARKWDFGDGNTSVATTPTHRYAEPGVYTVSLTITTSVGDMTAKKDNYIVVRSAGALRANFTFDTSGGAMPYVDETVQFFDLSEAGRGEITSWEWDFGDGSSSVEQNPRHRFRNIGTYTVTLTVASDFGSDSTERTLTVTYRPPVADFLAEPEEQWINTPILFADRSVAGYAEIISWEWDFGDGNTSTDQNPVHAYTAAGTYTVRLTVTADDTEDSSDTLTKRDYIHIRGLPDPPDPRFSYVPRLALVDERVTFDASDTTITDEPILVYAWDLGDGSEMKTGRTTSHFYTEPGRYTVTLTVVTESTSNDDPPGISQSRNIVVDRAPSPAFTVDPTEGYTYIDQIIFQGVAQLPDAQPIRQYLWDFGDDNTSNEPAPIHLYEAEGQYRANLTVSFRHTASRTADPDLERTASRSITIKPSIYDYVQADDGCYFYSNPYEEPIMLGGQQVATAYLIYRLSSQCWNPDDSVSGEWQRWVHPVTIIDPLPQFKRSDTAMLFIDGGSRNSGPAPDFAQIAILTGTTVVHLKNVPSQPIVFREEVIRAGEDDNFSGQNFILRRRTEDEIIAYSYDKYLESYAATGGRPNYEWPLLFPMAKSAVKAMDMTEEILGEDAIADFVVAGASKRGWTTWLTAAVDPRVKAIAPMVINVLNMKPHLEHHRAAYGYWSPAIYDYAQERVFDRLLPGNGTATVTPGAQTLLDYVDPYEYSLRGSFPMPKFMLNATGDEFFVPDTAEYYFHDLEPDAHQTFVPNVGHGMGLDSLDNLTPEEITNPRNAVGMLVAWYMAVSQDRALPQFSYSFEGNGAILVDVDPDRPPVAAYLWRATSVGRRDFRNHIVGDAWSRIPLSLQAGGTTGAYYITPPIAEPDPGNYTAYFVQLEYANDGVRLPPGLTAALQGAGYSVPNLVFSTGVRVTPEEFPEFTGYIANIERPDAVFFDETKLPVAVVYGTPFEMGYYYGQLLAPRINAFVRDYLAYYMEMTGSTTGQLMEAWNMVAPFLDARMHQEMMGIVEAEGITITLGQLQMAHAAALFEVLGTWTATGTFAYREMLQDGNAALAASLNSLFHRHQCAVLYIPDDGVPHTVLTHAGLTFGRTGVNLGGISALEITDLPIVDEDTGDLIDPYTGEPFEFMGMEPNSLPLIRSILYDALSLREAIDMAKATTLLRPTTLMLGDGRNETRGVRLRMYPENVVLEERYDLALTNFEIENRRGILYSTTTVLQPVLQAALEEVLTPQTSIAELLGISQAQPFAQPGANAMNLLIDQSLLNIFVAIARDGAGGQYFEAYRDDFDAFNMQLLLP